MVRGELPPITSILSYGERGWTSQFDANSQTAIFNKIKEYNICISQKEDFATALDICCDKFCNFKKKTVRPWYQHYGNKLQYERKESEQRLLQELGKTWQLDWYWKMLIPRLYDFRKRGLLEKDRKIYIRLSQVRSWVLLTVYSVEKVKGDYVDLLLCEPLFGRSPRLYEWDQYWIYLAALGIIIREWQLNKDLSPAAQAYVVGRHDVVYELIDPQKIDFDDDKHTITITMKGSIDIVPYYPDKDLQVDLKQRKNHVCSPYDLLIIPPMKNIVEIRDDAKVVNVAMSSENGKGKEIGNLANAANIEPDILENEENIKELTKPVKLLLASNRVCEALELISDVWNDPTMNIIHLNAPPGSGKEKLCDTIVKCKVYKKYKLGETINTLSLSPTDYKRNERSLFGYQIGEDSPPDDVAKGITYEPGFIEKSFDGLLIIDEVDKASDDIRVSLLRALESYKFLIPGTMHIVGFEKRKPAFVFLSSKPLNTIYDECGPRDFWTRIPFTVEMKHPFDIHNLETRKKVIKQYVWMFWMKHVENYFDHLSQNNTKEDRRVITTDNFTPLCINNTKAFLLSSCISDYISNILSEEIKSRFSDISVRNIRGIANRCVFMIIQCVLFGKKYGEGGPIESEDFQERINKIIATGDYVEFCDSPDLQMALSLVVKNAIEQRVEYPG